MAVKQEISNNYFKITDGTKDPVRLPFRDVRVQISETLERVNFTMKGETKKLFPTDFEFADGYATGTVTIDTTSPTAATGDITLASAVATNTVTVNGNTYTGVTGVKADNTEFSVDTSDTAAATDLADSITNDVRAGTVNDVTATSSLGVVTVTATPGGTIGNTVAMSENTGGTTITVDALLTGGLDDAEVSGITVNSVEIMSGAVTTADGVDVLAQAVIDNINGTTSSPNYTAALTGSGEITLTPTIKATYFNTYVVASTVVKATSTDVNLSGAGVNFTDSGDAAFASWAAYITFIEKNTGGELIA
jgi:hypothetical protein